MKGRSDLARGIGGVTPERVAAAADGPSDGELMAQLRAGEVAALGSLYRRYGEMVSCVVAAYMTSSDRAEREDVCQEVFLTLMNAAGRYQEQAKLAPFLRGIALRKARAVGRRKWLRSHLLDRFWRSSEEAMRPQPKPVDDLLSTQQSLARVIDVLPTGQREVVLLRFVADMDDVEVAQALGISRTTVSTRLHRARQTLRALRNSIGDDL